MNLASELSYYAPAIALDSILSRKKRKTVQNFLKWILPVLFVVYIGLQFYGAFRTEIYALKTASDIILGMFFVVFGMYLVFFMMNVFYRTRYFRGTLMYTPEEYAEVEGITLDVAKVCYLGKDDLTSGFLTSTYGEEILARLGISQNRIKTFLATDRQRVSAETFPLADGRFSSIFDMGVYLYESDQAFREFLFAQGVTETYFVGACSWISRVRILHRSRVRWWSRDNLAKIQGLGREFSYGIAYELKRYFRDIYFTSALSVMLTHVEYAERVIAKLEVALTRSRATNALIVGDVGVGKMDMLIELGARIREGRSSEVLKDKHLVVFDTEAFIATHNSKETFENAFLTLMEGAERAGNIILIIEDLTAFLSSLKTFGSDGSALIERFLSSSEIQVIATTTSGDFHRDVETDSTLTRSFEVIHVEAPDLSNVITVLEEAVWQHEYTYNCFFTYASVARVAQCAEQYLVEGVMPDKALNLLAEIASTEGGKKKITLITPEVINTYVGKKVGVPVGVLAEDERAILLSLEDELHKRVVGQHDAILAISSAMRRVRAGIQNTARPLGPFLFLGPTGVGKTETAKALTELFFKTEENMVRLDMSEFSGGEGVDRLIGNNEQPGILSSVLREHPYCVLLLDEFEKASEEVHDIFLQILDEGGFTSGDNQHINMRNCIIIATSNAGSSYIWKLIEEGKRPHDERKHIINAIIEDRVFKPELLNRFDACIIFNVLTEEEQEHIAEYMLLGLKERMRESGYDLVIDEVLRGALRKVGYDTEFGARPMRRAIQDVIESKIATKILEGSIQKGDSIQFVPADFE
jgi:ATP-dependent Clp protease ATP-binding subunit ClpA